jgi:hypothetical protein
MSKTVQVWLDDEADEALALLCSTGMTEADAVGTALVAAAGHVKAHPLVADPVALERALDKSHDVIAEILTTQRPPR